MQSVPLYSLWELIINAAITPGIHPAMVKMVTIKTEPQPLSRTASGGKIRHIIARPKLMLKTPFKQYTRREGINSNELC